ncbi:aLK and LTK ligand 2a [Mastacembelus armatus]|uniref:aLK and LTK ligand 2a n=1 Tax=Mastacembelus armatus TaxID=205130 RepID=UPI000E462A5B|nr:ALK and LTK ligand 2-like [Mastacembelus armatus]
MSGLRKHFTMGLVLLMCTLTRHCGESAPQAVAAARRDTQHGSKRMVQIVKQVEESRGRYSAKTEAPLTSRVMTPPVDLRNLKTETADEAVVVYPRDLRKKGKFIEHLTDPHIFNLKCRKHVYRLYYHTRDCTIPAFFRRCARLLTRLAVSPQCTEG